MKTKTIIQNVLTLAAVVALTGCATSGYQKADKTSQSIAEFRSEIVKAKKAIDGTMKSLDQIAVSATTNPRKAFEQFSKNVATLESSASRARKCAEEMKTQGKAYFDQWEKELAEVKNEEVRKLASERKAKLQETFDSIRKAAEPLKTQFGPWMSDLKDLEKYLANDLTIAGVDAVKKLFVKTQDGGAEVQKSMDALVNELNTVAATITPAREK